MAEIILHVGFHKTGSTTIQRNLHAHRETLAEQGFYYPSLAANKSVFTSLSTPLRTMFGPAPENYTPNVRMGNNAPARIRELIASYGEQFAEEAERADGRPILISAEEVSTLKAEHLTAMRAFLERYADRIRVIAYVRRPYDFLCSIKAQHIKTGWLLSENRYPASLPERIKAFREVFDPVEVYSFEAAVGHASGPLGHFADLVGIDVAAFGEISRENASPSDQALRLINGVNEQQPLYLRGEKGERLLNPARKAWDINAFFDIPGKKFRLTEEEVQPFLARLRKDDAWLAREFGPEFASRDLEFGEVAPWGKLQRDALRTVLAEASVELRLLAYGYFVRTGRMNQERLREVFFQGGGSLSEA